MKKIIVVLAVAGIAYFAYMRFMPHGPGGPMGGAALVSVAEVVARPVREWNEFSGRLVAVEQVQVRPQVSGLIQSVHFKNGQMVSKGELLFSIDPRPYDAALQAAKARAVLAESEIQRAQTLLAEKAIPQREFDQRKNAAEVARADLARARIDLDYTQIKSPIAGKVGRAEITEGNLVDAPVNAPVLTTVVSSTPIYADFEMGEDAYLRYVKSGAAGTEASRIPVTLVLDGGDSVLPVGHVESFDNRLDPASGTIRVRAVFDNTQGALVPGVFARIRVGGADNSQALLITDRAVGTDQNKKFVLVVNSESKLEYREVKLGGMADGLRIVREGLQPGEKILVSGITPLIRPGVPVVPEVVPMDDRMPDAGDRMSSEVKKENPAKE